MAGVVQGFLATSATDAALLAPASISPFSGWTVDDVRTYLAAAVQVAEKVSRRLNLLHALSDRQAALWSAPASPEQYWFGDFSAGKVNTLWWTFQEIKRHLSSRRLEVICKTGMSVFGRAVPFVEKIWLGNAWLTPNMGADDDSERVVTFVHEAAHISGRVTLGEGKTAGRTNAHALALTSPRRALRHADSYGYYAIDVAEKPALVAT